jgi:hypothetical protein
MIALVCDWGGDLFVGPTGDIGVADASSEIQQRIIRRLLTNSGDYIWHTEYGAGLGLYVGEPYSPGLVEDTILLQLQQEQLVAASPSPTVQIDQNPAQALSSLSITISYQVKGMSTGTSIVVQSGA